MTKLERIIPGLFDGVKTDEPVTLGSTLTVTGAITATGGVTGTASAVAGTVAATTLTSSGTTFLAYPKYDGVVTDYDAQAATLTVAGMAGGTVSQNSQTGASTLTTPTGAQITAAFGDVTGTTLDVMFNNRGNQTSTITAGDGAVVVKGTAAVPTTKNALMRFVNVSTGAWNCYVIVTS